MVYDLAAEEYSVYDLSAKIWPESDPVYDLTAIDTSRGRTASVEDQRPVVARRCAGYRSPSTVIAATARSISARLSAVSSTLAAPRQAHLESLQELRQQFDSVFALEKMLGSSKGRYNLGDLDSRRYPAPAHTANNPPKNSTYSYMNV